MTPDQVIDQLKSGNERYTGDRFTLSLNAGERRLETSTHGQHPQATILCCSDSRVPPEMIFDLGIGELFVVRVAGNIAGPSEIGSIEFAVDHLNTPLVLVLGHTKCGAIKAAMSDEPAPRNVDHLLRDIRKIIRQTREDNPDATTEQLIEIATVSNVEQSINRITNSIPVAPEKIEKGELKVIGAIYDIETGEIDWMD